MNVRIFNIKKYRLRNLFRIERRRLPFNLQYDKLLIIVCINTHIEIRHGRTAPNKLFNNIMRLQNEQHKRNNGFKKQKR